MRERLWIVFPCMHESRVTVLSCFPKNLRSARGNLPWESVPFFLFFLKTQKKGRIFSFSSPEVKRRRNFLHF
ncbi:Hypothetical protein Minf_2052 [Methylacidiphilum infernorum V4]|uniref:Uncharacterized protein n=1 Tax=Methylacidiphilum infernorum (isolate V4) TaxID=481448 RepID=B3DZ14_METI4|nr:Hypothetical protein Minf_2052 [Methylacidiphilum infernorum V4]